MDDYLAEAADPATDPERLRDIAYRYPDARRAVAANPNAYPELVDWIELVGDRAADDDGRPAGDETQPTDATATFGTTLPDSTVIAGPPSLSAPSIPPAVAVSPVVPGAEQQRRRLNPLLLIPLAVLVLAAVGIGAFALGNMAQGQGEAPAAVAASSAAPAAGGVPAPSEQPSTAPSATSEPAATLPPMPTHTPTPTPAVAEQAGLIGSDGVYRDALLTSGYSDESPTWLVLHEAAESGAKLRLELAVFVPEGGFNDILSDGSAWIGAPPVSSDPDTQYTAPGGMGYWIVVPRATLVDGGADKTFVRVTGTFTVRQVNTERLEEFHLTQVSDKVAPFPPGLSDPDRCDTAAAFAQTQADVTRAADELRANPERYQALKVQWIAAPRIWWAVKMTARGDGGDLVTLACGPWIYK